MNRAFTSVITPVLLVAMMITASAQQRPMYKLGPGDTVNVYILGKPETKAEGLPIAPDGSLSYQEAKVNIAGLTVPEARKRLEDALKKTERSARVVLSPGTIGSKSYTILGQVPEQGRFILDRRVTLLEAIAKAGGISKDQASFGVVNERVNLDKSFIVRKGRKLAVDFTSLYFRGDTSQNIVLQNEDHIYIASNLGEEFYVFGYVNNPGLQRITNNLGVIGAITQQAGFAPDAWKGKVLLVRGSMTEPETIVVDVGRVLTAKAADVKIQSGDILYVHRKPWFHAETILDSAFTAFLRSMATTQVDIETGVQTR